MRHGPCYPSTTHERAPDHASSNFKSQYHTQCEPQSTSTPHSTPITVTQRHSRLAAPPTLHTPPHSAWQRLEFGKLMNEAGGVLAPPGQLIHEAACFRAAQPT